MVFFDSNVWLYALFSQQSPTKSALAKTLIRNNQREIVLSSQVVLEVGANLLRKAKFSEAQIAQFIKNVYEDYLAKTYIVTLFTNASIGFCRTSSANR